MENEYKTKMNELEEEIYNMNYYPFISYIVLKSNTI